MKKPRIPINSITVRVDDIPETLKRIRSHLRLTQRNVAKMAGLSTEATVSNLETGMRRLHSDSLDKILKAFGLEIDTVTFRRIDKG